MSEQMLLEEFDIGTLDARLAWRCPPSRWSINSSRLTIEPDAKTDFWQKTHYGFEADNGHFLFCTRVGDFVLSTRLRLFPVHQYDQAGLMVRFSSECWLKTSVEFEPTGPSQLGAVVTNAGYSDWSTQSFVASAADLELRVRREGDDFIVEYLRAEEGVHSWRQIRMAHLLVPAAMPIECGLYACCPKESGFRAEFDFLKAETS
jgi:regulation of enolase protein 1 (concanavalin A-like superfamily)